jgi:long-chain acyl-CoA synthetase
MIRAIVCNKKSVKILLGKLDDMPTLKVIIYTNNMIAPDEKIDLSAAPTGVTVVSFQDFVDAGDTKAFAVVPPQPDTTAVIMYTSGSTGEFYLHICKVTPDIYSISAAPLHVFYRKTEGCCCHT